LDEEILDPVRDLLPALREDAVRVEALRTVPERTMESLAATGLLRTFQPVAVGGAEGDPLTFFTGVRLLAGACGSTGWTVSLMGASSFHVSLLEPQSAVDVWSEDPHALVTASYAPLGRLVPAESGYRLSGTWTSVMGAALADWMILGSQVIGRTGEPIDYAAVLVPRSAVRLGEAWHAIGLRGTGTRVVEVAEAEVPAHRVYGTARRNQLIELLRKPEASTLFRVPFGSLYATSISAPLVGMAEGAYSYYVERTRARSRLTLGTRGPAHRSATLAVTRGLSTLDASVLQMDRNLGEVLECGRNNVPVPMELRMRVRRDQVLAVETSVESIELLIKTAGGHGVQGDTPIQRAWRDIHTGAAHLVNNADQAMAAYGKWVLGMGVDDSMLLV
jgi:3-hydroxy-9,10-secoandrosta-1,3,5(10)-triene-9,17-dione monooxygenase